MSRPTGSSPRGDRAQTNPNRIGTVLVLGGVVLAVATIVIGGFLPTADALVATLYPLALLLPVIGAILVLSAGWLLLATHGRAETSPLVEGTPPEDAVTVTDHRVGREIDWDLDNAGSQRYRCQTNEAAADIRRRLVDGTVRILTTTYGLEREAAAEAARTGTWTDDPVAAAFLATGERQPPAERWRGAVDPGRAYERRVRRTLAAVEALETGERNGPLESDSLSVSVESRKTEVSR
ncbi:DUF7269 family protein [Salinadaptatus halalkaliphilus]|uniref:DUF7269 family protein n=1 Tax=Salinadaptatus halalkaliphilus TaxID=2419781 RepID=UPI001580C3AF|nr:hypothetical protein [Salinadaptatus halalkaliphilus]